MATSKKFSELPAASSVGNGDLFAIAHEDALAETGYVSQKLTAAQAGQKVNGDTEYPTSLPSFPTNGQNPFAALEKLNQDIIDLYPVNTASGSIANFTTSLEMPLTALSTEIVAQQAGSGTPSPQNERSISGFSEVKLGQVSDYAEYFNGLLLGTYDFVDLGTLTWANGTGGAARFVASRASSLPKAQGNIICDILETSTNTAIYSGSVDDAIAIHTNNTIWARDTSYSTPTDFTTAMDGHYAIYELDTPKTPTITAEQFATLCTAFGITGETKTIALGQTVYGGVLDAKSGNAIIDKALIIFDGSEDESWVYNSNYNGFSIPIPDMVSGNQLNGLCNWLEQVSSSTGFGFRLGANNRALYCYHITDNISGVTDLATWKTYLSNNILQIVYPLEAPQEITGLTPANFTTFAGEQNIFADSGDISVSFKQGIQEYIDAKIAETQALIL